MTKGCKPAGPTHDAEPAQLANSDGAASSGANDDYRVGVTANAADVR